MSLLRLLDHLFFAFHTLLIAFNMTGWAWRRTRLAHAVVLGLTFFSWFAMGAFRGWGYCLCTDWHFQLRRHLGDPVPESSFIQLFARQALGLHVGKQTCDRLAAGVLAAIVVATALAWAAEWRRRNRAGLSPG